MDAAADTSNSLANARVTIDLAALADNWRQIAALAPAAETSAVVKADGYGIGLAPAMRTLAGAGCRTFFVATSEEGVAAREVDPGATIYLLDGLPQRGAALCGTLGLRPVLGSMAEIREWATWKRHGGEGDAALHIDTGMNRLGLSAAELNDLLADPALLALVSPALVMSHLACADTPANPLNARQLARFAAARAFFPGAPASLANSAGIQLGAAYHFDLTRPGIMLYGGRGDGQRPPLRTVVTAEARILRVRDVPPGASVGYGASQRVARPSRLATLGAGYADGYIRRAGSTDDHRGAEVFLHGRRASLVGRVSMDLIVADVTDIPHVERGDWVELFGSNVAIDEVAGHAGTISYELLTGLSRRADRRLVGA